MANSDISSLPAAGALDGTEPVPVVQGGDTKQTTTQDIADLAESTPVALASLGSATGVYKRAMISDGLTLGTWGAAAVDGGVVVKPVWSNGVAWLNG